MHNSFSGNYFSENNSNPPRPARCTRCSAPAVADERTRLPAGPTGQGAEGRGSPTTARRRRCLPAGTNGTNAFASLLRLDPTPLLALKSRTASWPPAMADRRRCRSGAGHHAPVERSSAASRDSGSHGDHNACPSEAREGREGESQRCRRRGELRRGRGLSDERFSPLEPLTCAKKLRPSTRRRMRSSERWKEVLEGDGVPGTRRTGKLRWRAAVLRARRGGERARERAHRVEARMAKEVALSTAEVGVVAPASRACRPRGAVGLTRSGARGAAVSERVGRRRGRGAGWLRWLGRLVGAGPPVNSPSFLFFNYFSQTLF